MKPAFLHRLILAALSLLFFFPFLGNVHLFDWDEINFAEAAREMIVTGDYLRMYIGYHPFWEKPPLFIWMQAMSMQLFGVGEFAARFPNALCGLITLQVLYTMGKRFYGLKFGLIWALTYFASFLPHFYFKSGIIDPWFNFFMFLSLYHFILFHWRKNEVHGQKLGQNKWVYLLLSGFWVGLAVLTKGPVGFLIVGLTIFVFQLMIWRDRYMRKQKIIPLKKKTLLFFEPLEVIVFILTAFFLTALWYGIETLKNGPWFVREFISYQIELLTKPVAGHKKFLLYHFVILFFGCFPMSVFGLRGLWHQNHYFKFEKDLKRWMQILFWVVLILFTVVESKIVHYSSMCYFPLSFLAALVIFGILEKKEKLSGRMWWLLAVLGCLYGLVITLLPLVAQKLKTLDPNLIKDEFARANFQAEAGWTGLEALIGVFFTAGVIAAFLLIRKGSTYKGFITLAVASSLLMFFALTTDVPKIERYSQGAAIDFYKSLKNKDCYIMTIGFKSYAQFFYTDMQPGQKLPYPPTEKGENKAFLFTGKIDKDAYFVCKIHRLKKMEGAKDLIKLGEKNGFVFFKREKTE